MGIEKTGGVHFRHRSESKIEKKFEPKTKITIRENSAERYSNTQFRGDQLRLKLNDQLGVKTQPQTIDDKIKNLERVKRNLPPEDQQAIDRSIKGLELTRDAGNPAKVREMAEKLVAGSGGVEDFDSGKAGKDLAEIARLSPAAGKAVLDETLKIVKTDDRDEIAQDLVENLSDAELSKLAKTTEGNALLKTAETELDEGRTTSDEKLTINRVDAALASATETQTDAVKAAAARVQEVMEYDVIEGGQILADEIQRLNALHGTDAGGELMTKIYQDMPHELGASLRLMDDLPESQKNSLGRALGQTFDGLGADGKTNFAEWVSQWTVADAFTPPLPGVINNQASSFGDLISRSFNTEMKTAVVNQMMAQAATIKPRLFGDNGGVDVQALFTSAAVIAESAPRTERAEMLKTIVETLPNVNLPSLIKDPATKDALSSLFMKSGEDLLHLAAPDGAYQTIKFQNGMIKFFELTLFSEKPGEMRPEMMEYVVKLSKDVGDAAATPPISQAEYERTHGGWSQQDHVEVMGGLFAMTWQAAENQKGAISADRKQREDTVKMFTGLAFSFVPGAGKVLGELGGEGAEFLDQIAGTVRDYAWDQLKSSAKDAVESQISELISGDSLANIDKMIENLQGAVVSLNALLPNDEEGELDLRGKFQSGFAFYNLVQF